jgi:hypothetical protein
MIKIYEVINNLEKEIIDIKDENVNRDTVKSIIKILYERPEKTNYKYYFVEDSYKPSAKLSPCE